MMKKAGRKLVNKIISFLAFLYILNILFLCQNIYFLSDKYILQRSKGKKTLIPNSVNLFHFPSTHIYLNYILLKEKIFKLIIF